MLCEVERDEFGGDDRVCDRGFAFRLTLAADAATLFTTA
jgi:hypothetical protein